MDVFLAIAHPVRRDLLDLLADGELPVNQLAAPFQMSRPAISQHLSILLEVGLVSERKVGRERLYRVNPAPLREVGEWLRSYERAWAPRR
jgi:DNA-binding transcriptional ArsR family regulator